MNTRLICDARKAGEEAELGAISSNKIPAGAIVRGGCHFDGMSVLA